MRSKLTRAVCACICALVKSKRDKDRSAEPMLLCSSVCRLLVLLGALVFISDSLNERVLGPSQGQKQGTAAQTAGSSQHRDPQFEKSGSRKRQREQGTWTWPWGVQEGGVYFPGVVVEGGGLEVGSGSTRQRPPEPESQKRPPPTGHYPGTG